MSLVIRKSSARKSRDRNRVAVKCLFECVRAAGAKRFGRYESQGKGGLMRILTLTVILGLPLMALGQTEPQQTTTQGQTKETETTAPAKGKKMRPEQAEPGKPQAKPETAKPETGRNVRGQTNVQGGARKDMNTNQPGARSSTSTGTSQTNVNQSTKVNVQEFKSRHSEVFSLGRHPKEFFVQRF